MAAFKEHCRFVLWKGRLLSHECTLEQFGRITAVADLPPRAELMRIVKEAAKLNEQGARSPARAKKAVKKEAVVPADLKAALAKNARAKKSFADFSPSCRREYVSWIVEAKRDETRRERIATAVSWIAEGKKRNWRYEKR
jgi:uncharacterized protein YdeI (YjbR/CyaY-like superfamily)